MPIVNFIQTSSRLYVSSAMIYVLLNRASHDGVMSHMFIFFSLMSLLGITNIFSRSLYLSDEVHRLAILQRDIADPDRNDFEASDFRRKDLCQSDVSFICKCQWVQFEIFPINAYL